MGFTKKDTQAIKGVAILMMFFHHCFLKMDRFDEYGIISTPFTSQQLIYFAQFCKICVGIFVFISAYGITLSFRNKNQIYMSDKQETMVLVCRRYLKMMSGYWFIFILVMAFAAVYDPGRIQEKYFKSGNMGLGIGYMFMDMLGLSKLFKTPKFIPTWWYMSLATIIVVLMPVLLRMYNRLGILLLPLCIIAMRLVKLRNSEITDWFFCLTVGIIFADFALLSKIREWAYQKKKWFSPILKFILMTGLLVFCVVIRQSAFGGRIMEVCDGICTAVVICYCNVYLIHIRGIRQILCLLGKYSMTMFLTHTFIRKVWMGDFTYHWKYAGLIWLSLVVTSLLLAVILDWLKEVTRYQKACDRNIEKITSCIMKNK